MTIKRLDLDTWMLHPLTFEDTIKHGGYEPRIAVIHRPGRYLSHSACWFELPDGRAFIDPNIRQFKYELELLEASRLNKGQVDALEAVKTQKLATKGQLRLLRMYWDYQGCRNTYRNAVMFRRKIMKC